MINEKSKKTFEDMPIWKSIIKMSLTTMLLMTVYGLYNFSDYLLSVNLAFDKYEHLAEGTGYSSKDLIRIFFTAFSPIASITFAIIMFISQGLSKRYSINLGAKNKERAISTLQTTMMFMLMFSFALIPILILITKPWIYAIYKNSNPELAKIIADESFKYFFVMIISFPINVFNQINTTVLRSEAKNRRLIVSIIVPIFFNLFFDWVLMGPLKMGIEGGAWATFISNIITSIILIIFIKKTDSEIATFKNMFGFKYFKWIVLLGIALVGAAPLFRFLSESLVSTLTTIEIQKVSNKVYGDSTQMIIFITSIGPLMTLFFPILFGIVHGASSVIGYNYGAKNFKRVKEGIMWIMLFTFIVGTFIYVLSSFLLIKPLVKMGGVQNTNLDKSIIIFKILMLSSILIFPAIGATSLFGSTDRLGFSLLVSLMRGSIIFLPTFFLFSFLAKENSGNFSYNLNNVGNIFSKQYILWWYSPVTTLISSFISLILMIFTFKRLEKKNEHLEDRINNFIKKIRNNKKRVFIKSKKNKEK